ncbi:MAG TPA: hypothetical protein VEC93_14415 [Anaerolineae bacterium]|nr:hypothetical protein [Anaerolineae bacterium]
MKPTFLFPVTPLFLRLFLAGLLSLALAVLLLPIPPALAHTFTPTLTVDLTDTNPGDSRCDALVDFIFSRRPIYTASGYAGNKLLSILAVGDQAGELGGSKETTSPI